MPRKIRQLLTAVKSAGSRPQPAAWARIANSVTPALLVR